MYDGLRLDSGYRIDLPVKNTGIVELKCVETLLPIHKTQLLTYLRLANKPLGMLLNFNVVHLRDGIKRVLNNKYQAGIAAEITIFQSSASSVPLCFKDFGSYRRAYDDWDLVCHFLLIPSNGAVSPGR